MLKLKYIFKYGGKYIEHLFSSKIKVIYILILLYGYIFKGVIGTLVLLLHIFYLTFLII